jgi:hypothetical protein
VFTLFIDKFTAKNDDFNGTDFVLLATMPLSADSSCVIVSNYDLNLRNMASPG